MSFASLWAEIAPIGRQESGGYLRYALSEPELALRDWFRGQAARRGMTVTSDGNGNLFAWTGEAWADGVVLVGSHFDSVPHGGGYDGPLGIVSAFLAVDRLRASAAGSAAASTLSTDPALSTGSPGGTAETSHPTPNLAPTQYRGGGGGGGREDQFDDQPKLNIGIVAFCEEEGGRWGVPCLGSRLLTGAIDPGRAAALTDRDGITFADALGAAPAGARPLTPVKAMLELHIEQGRALAQPVGVASAIWPHGRWRFDFRGTADHAGTTRMQDRRDPMLTYAYTILAANKEARLAGAHATMARVAVEPNATNAIPSLVRAWLDARAADTATLDALVEAVTKRAVDRAGRDGTTVEVTAESVSPEVAFDTRLARRLADLLDAPILPTGAGHDAGVLSAHVPTAMLFVRNPTGVSHSPAEHASDADCEAGVTALAQALEALS